MLYSSCGLDRTTRLYVLQDSNLKSCGMMLQVEAGDLLHDGHYSRQAMTVAVIYHGYTDG